MPDNDETAHYLESSGEVRVTDPKTGGQKGAKPARYDLIPVPALKALALHYGAGAKKYEDNQWRKGFNWSLAYAAAQRHLNDWWNGEDIDPDPSMGGASNLAAAAWQIFTLMTFAEEYPEGDDRYKADPK